jgi:YHS domain-containing protein
LEQAVSLDATNGQAYYFLSEAWLMKGSATQAKEFNQLAEIHLKEDSEWMIRVAQQADRIAELEK